MRLAYSHARTAGLVGSTLAFLVAASVIMTRPLDARPRAVPPTQNADTQPLARYFPAQNLVVFAEFDGIQAHAAAWSKSAAHSILAETPTGAMLGKLLRRVVAVVSERGGPMPIAAPDLIAIAEHAMKQGFAVGVVRPPDSPKPTVLTLVVRGAGGGPIQTTLAKLLDTMRGPRAQAPKVNVAGRQVTVVEGGPTPPIAWWFEGADLVVSLAGQEGAAQTIAALEGRVPNAVNHELRRTLAQREGAFEPFGWAYFDMAALPPLPPDAIALGLGGLKRVEYRWGIENQAIKTSLRVLAPAPRAGVLAVLDQPPIQRAGLPALPAGLASATAFSLKPERLLASFQQLEAASRRGRSGPALLDDIKQNLQEKTGRDLVKDLLAPLGPTMVSYELPTPRRVPTNPIIAAFESFARTPKSVLIIDLANAPQYADTLDVLMPEINKDLQSFMQQMQSNMGMSMERAAFPEPTAHIGVEEIAPTAAPDVPDAREVPPPPRPPAEPKKATQPASEAAKAALETLLIPQDTSPYAGPKFVRVAAPFRGWMLDRPMAGSFFTGAGMRPTILVGKTHLYLGATFETARDALQAEGQPGTLPANDPLAAPLQAAFNNGATFVHVSDPRATGFADVLCNLPALLESIPVGAMGLRGNPGLGPMAPGFTQMLFGFSATGTWLNLPFLPEELPTPDQIQARLFPSTYVLRVNDDGILFESTEALPTFNPVTLLPIGAAVLLPAVTSARQAAQRAQSINNLKQIVLAIHNFHEANNRMPADIRDPNGKPLLSWRVELLPFLEQQPTFEAIHKDEPWDSPHNKELLASMPALFRIPESAAPEPGLTFYRGFSGPHTAFEGTPGANLSLASFTDGTSNTIAVVEAREAVPWMKPESDIPFDAEAKPGEEKDLSPLLGGHFPDGFNAAFMDGSVRFLRDSINARVLRALITRDLGEVVSSDEF